MSDPRLRFAGGLITTDVRIGGLYAWIAEKWWVIRVPKYCGFSPTQRGGAAGFVLTRAVLHKMCTCSSDLYSPNCTFVQWQFTAMQCNVIFFLNFMRVTIECYSPKAYRLLACSVPAAGFWRRGRGGKDGKGEGEKGNSEEWNKGTWNWDKGEGWKGDIEKGRARSKRVPHTNCALRIKKCAPRISSGIYFLSTS